MEEQVNEEPGGVRNGEKGKRHANVRIAGFRRSLAKESMDWWGLGVEMMQLVSYKIDITRLQ